MTSGASEPPELSAVQEPTRIERAVQPQEPAPILPSGSWLRSVCRAPRDEDSLPFKEGEAKATAAASADATEIVEDEMVPAGALEQKFEDEFQQHLKKSNKISRMQMGAVGAGLGAGLGFLAAPVLLPGIVIAGIAGTVGGYKWGKMKGLKRLQKHGAGARPACSATAQHRPTLRRLRYLVRWGHWQLLEYEGAPAEWRAAVLVEVVRAFSQWVQAMFLVRARLGGGVAEVDPEAQEIFQHLSPLYQCLQRGVFSEAMTQACSFVDQACDTGVNRTQVIDTEHAELCTVIFPTVLETISIMDRLAPSTYAKLIEAKDAGSPVSVSKKSKNDSEQEVARPLAVQRTQGRQRLRKIVDVIRQVLEQAHVVDFLANPKAFERASPQEDDELSACDELAEDLVSAESDPELDEVDATLSSQTRASPASALSNMHRSPSRNRVPLVVPPMGVEEEAGEAAFHSCSEDEEPLSGPGTPSSASSSTSPPEASKVSATAPNRSNENGAKPRPSDSSPKCSRLKDRLADLPRGRQNHQWDRFDESTFDVRSVTYLKDKKKAPSGPSLLELLSIDFFRIPPGGPITNAATRRGFHPMELRRQKDGRFLFIQNWIFPPFQALIISALDPQAPWLRQESPQARAWHRFLAGSLEDQKKAFKVIACVENGPWLVKRAAPKKPVLVGRKLKMETRYEPGQYLELSIDVSGSKTDAIAVGMVMKAFSRLELVLAMLIESKQEDELPETLLVCAAMKGVDTSRLAVPDESWDWD